jgi:hypothetical protein
MITWALLSAINDANLVILPGHFSFLSTMDRHVFPRRYIKHAIIFAVILTLSYNIVMYTRLSDARHRIDDPSITIGRVRQTFESSNSNSHHRKNHDQKEEEAHRGMGLYWGKFTQSRENLYRARIHHVPPGYGRTKACERTPAPVGAPVKGKPNWCKKNIVGASSLSHRMR